MTVHSAPGCLVVSVNTRQELDAALDEEICSPIFPGGRPSTGGPAKRRRAKGATLHAGGELQLGPAAYIAPAVLTGVRPGMRAYNEELFGPAAVVYKVSSDEEALRLANDTQYGLGGAVFSKDEKRARKIAEHLDVGMTNVNVAAADGAEMPFGGIKRSGFGRELGPLGMEEFVNKHLLYIGG
jgi:succinate-semialdehyde dehydrogenase / glutarate-semialdehyde dehydrogenase